MTSAQADQGIYSYGNNLSPLRTGYEGVIGDRVTSDKFATQCQQDGKVIKVTPHGITVLYKDGARESKPLGLLYGESAGVIHPHEVVTMWKEGDVVKKGYNLTYHKHYFQPDRISPGHVLHKQNMTITVALLDNINELEDGSMITEETARKLTTAITEHRDVLLNFDQHLTNMLDVGDHVDLDTVLAAVADPGVEYTGDLSEASLNTLSQVKGKVHKANTSGFITRMEVYYRGEFEELSDELKKTVELIEKRNLKIAKESGQKFFPGKVDTSFRRKGTPLEPHQVVVRYFVTHDMGIQRGDKATFSLQLKSIFSAIMQGRNMTVGGIKLDGIFGTSSVLDRMVNSPYHNGMASMLLRVMSKHVVEVYKGNAKPHYAKR